MFKEKYASALNEYEKFWERTNTERCVLNMSYRKEGAVAYRRPTSVEERWLDEEYVYNAFKHNVNNTGYIAEGVPMLFTNFGPGCLAACIGSKFGLTHKTVWFDQEPLITEWEDAPEIKLDTQSEMWQHVTRLQNKFASDPDVHYSITDIGGILDVVASLRSTEGLLYDLYDYPDEVKECTRAVTDAWFKMYDAQLEAVRKVDQPYNNWMNIPSSKPWYPLQCDFSYMISPQQFEEFVLPHLVEQAAYVDRPIYHLDGVGEIRHLDMLLDIPNLKGIQWVSGAGEAPLTDEKWFSLYRRIQDKKKNLILLHGISENDMQGAERLIKSIDPAGVYISVKCSSKEKAEDMLEKITLWSN